MEAKAFQNEVIEYSGLDELPEVAEKIIQKGKRYRVWLFEGEMGAGKTTLIKAICENFGVMDTVNSPTFSIVNEYRNEIDEAFYHFDFYRIKDEEEALAIGVYEYFDSGDFCFVEWPSKIKNILPDQALKIDISIKDKDIRKIELSRYE